MTAKLKVHRFCLRSQTRRPTNKRCHSEQARAVIPFEGKNPFAGRREESERYDHASITRA